MGPTTRGASKRKLAVEQPVDSSSTEAFPETPSTPLKKRKKTAVKPKEPPKKIPRKTRKPTPAEAPVTPPNKVSIAAPEAPKKPRRAKNNVKKEAHTSRSLSMKDYNRGIGRRTERETTRLIANPGLGPSYAGLGVTSYPILSEDDLPVEFMIHGTPGPNISRAPTISENFRKRFERELNISRGHARGRSASRLSSIRRRRSDAPSPDTLYPDTDRSRLSPVRRSPPVPIPLPALGKALQKDWANNISAGKHGLPAEWDDNAHYREGHVFSNGMFIESGKLCKPLPHESPRTPQRAPFRPVRRPRSNFAAYEALFGGAGLSGLKDTRATPSAESPNPFTAPRSELLRAETLAATSRAQKVKGRRRAGAISGSGPPASVLGRRRRADAVSSENPLAGLFALAEGRATKKPRVGPVAGAKENPFARVRGRTVPRRREAAPVSGTMPPFSAQERQDIEAVWKREFRGDEGRPMPYLGKKAWNLKKQEQDRIEQEILFAEAKAETEEKRLEQERRYKEGIVAKGRRVAQRKARRAMELKVREGEGAKAATEGVRGAARQSLSPDRSSSRRERSSIFDSVIGPSLLGRTETVKKLERRKEAGRGKKMERVGEKM
ncbi:hypothetical protein MMC18_006489 [Xylographa bjoerkii]|nr:hypothetical protein [Xylographa bjoerkii]